MRDAGPDDHEFVVEMARHACIIEDWPLPDPNDEDVIGLLPVAGEVPIIAEDTSGVPAGAVWTFHNDPPLMTDAAGTSLPELCIAVAPGKRGAGIGGLLLDALFIRLAATATNAICTNVHDRNPAQHLYQRKGFQVVGRGRGPLGVAMRKDLG